MKEINLSRGFVAIVDDEDYEKLSKYKWHVSPSSRDFKKYDTHYYAVTSTKGKNIAMHRMLLKPKKGLVCDHIDGDGLNNQRNNLRVATRSQNGANRKPAGISKYLGVTRCRPKGRWMVFLAKDRVINYLGSFTDEKEAALAYNKAAIKYHGEFARLNVIN